MLIVLDDLHAIDAPSLLFLQFLLRSFLHWAAAAKLVVVATVRDVLRGISPESDHALEATLRRARVVPVRGMALDEVAERSR